MSDEWTWDLPWDEQLLISSWKPPLELPEDTLFYFIRKNPYLEEMIEKHDLQMEI